MRFFKVETKQSKGAVEVFPVFNNAIPDDFMVRGKSFYAIWDEEAGRWSTNEYDVCRIVDNEIDDVCKKLQDTTAVRPLYMRDSITNAWYNYRRYVTNLPDNYHQLDNKLTFADTVTKKTDYSSKRLPYSLSDADCPAFNKIIGTLYDPEERDKIEWAVGSVVAGEQGQLQKFIALYGEAGTGKSTILNIIQDLFPDYWVPFDGKELTSASASFSAAPFATNPLVVIQHDSDLSKIDDNSRLNSIVSHETIRINEKYKAAYSFRPNAMIFIGTNRPVKITEAKSGVIRRLVNVHPTGNKLPPKTYASLMEQTKFELGAIANHCLNTYKRLGKHYYDAYRPTEMIEQTDVFYNFVEEYCLQFMQEEGISLKQAYALYKEYCDNSFMEYKLPMYKFREELKNYFSNFNRITRVGGKQVRSWYSGFCLNKVMMDESEEKPQAWLVLDKKESLLDEELADCFAQYSSEAGTPIRKWTNVRTVLRDIDTTKEHYVKVPQNHIVIDFDRKNSDGNKSKELNLEAANKWPETYAEFSKSGSGIHLHYIYDGDPTELSRIYADDIEIKVFVGNSSLRRKLSYCNDIPISHISSGLPLKGKVAKPVINFKSVKSEQGLRNLIERNLRKEIHPNTAPSVSLIYKALEDAYNNGVSYDVTDMRPKILTFAASSTHQANQCCKMVANMKFKSEDEEEEEPADAEGYSSDELVFFDIEVFPNLVLVEYMPDSADKPIRMFNPKPHEIEALFKLKLVGFNCRRYDNHILYALYLGKSIEDVYRISQRIVSGSQNGFFREAYNISYTDIYDFASAANKKSLKKFEIELGIHHQELGLPWDQPVPEDKWEAVADYCDNDVIATKATFHHLKEDWTARKILAKLSGLSVNDTTNHHSQRIIFGYERNPQNEFIYTKLAEPTTHLEPEHEQYLKDRGQLPEGGFTAYNGEKALLPFFPGYTFDHGKSIYRGEEAGEGGFVYAEPGYYQNVGLLDIASIHPTSVEAMCLFGPKYTRRFCDLKDARVAIKHKDREALKTILDGALLEFVDDPGLELNDLANALKTVINSVYGLTSAKFANAFRDPRNVDNIVAKRGALFMIDLMKAVQAKGWTVAHIKTDSIKIPDITQEKVDFVMEFGKKYGYTFEFEAVYERICLVNNAVYIAKYDEKGVRNKGGKHAGEWTATGAQFAQPYVFKTLFSGEPIGFHDLCEQRTTNTALYLDMNEGLPEDEHNYVFIGKTGLFSPIKEGCGGGILLWKKEDKYNAVNNTIGYRWLESEVVAEMEKEGDIDRGYFDGLVADAVENIEKYVPYEEFVGKEHNVHPWFSEEGLPLPF